MFKKISFILIILIPLSLVYRFTLYKEHFRDDVPGKYEAIYNELDKKLDNINNHIAIKWDRQKYNTVFCTELLTANSNRGEELLEEKVIKGVPFNLDRLVLLGVKGVIFNIAYPLLKTDFPHSNEYLEFYKKVAKEVRDRNLTLIIESGFVFEEPEFSNLQYNYSGLTFDEYKKEKRKMVETIIKEITPDYLTIENEPNTQKHITGLDFSVENYTDLLNYVLKNLNKNGVKIGAGAGTWDNIDYFEAAAKNPNIDYVDLHIYPVQRDYIIDKCELIYEMAKKNDKELAMTECWLYKVTESELNNSYQNEAKIFSRDVYSFWIPLDEKFIASMVSLSSYLHLEFCSFFWMQYFYGYIDYDSAIDDLPAMQILNLGKKNAAKNIMSNTLSETGQYFQKSIK